MSEKNLFDSLEYITRDLEKKRLADVFRFVSFKPFEKYGPHEHLRIEINFVKKGSCIVRMHDESVSFSKDEMMIICSNVNHSFEAGAEGATLMQLEFLPDVFLRLDTFNESTTKELTPATIFSEKNRLIKIVNNVRIMRSVQRIVNELNAKSKYYQYLVIMYYAELLILIFRHLDETYLPICTNDTLRKAIYYIRTNYRSDINVGDIAKHTEIGERYLRKLFAQNLSISPLDYLNQIRIDKSIELLRNTELSIKEIAFECGYQSPQYFSRIFKQRVGISPREVGK